MRFWGLFLFTFQVAPPASGCASFEKVASQSAVLLKENLERNEKRNETIMMINKASSSSSSPRSTRLGTFRAYYFGFFVCTAGFLFGYDTGIVGMFLCQ